MAYKEDWFEDASYEYGTRVYLKGDNVEVDNKTTMITFTFPNASTPDYSFTDILYKSDKDGKTVYTNETAQMLQCYIDKYYQDKKVKQ